ncbi:MAG: large conductance mechanosensitive channel protein MscL [Alkalinema sp. RU_4_3]|nr:large conductance mechanosensitive channel protein MscL [Alkalinema sp. RU_4_3]
MASSGFIADFKKFLLQGNAVDLAVAFIVGGAFSKIVTALVDKLFMPILSMITPGGDWKTWMIPLGGMMKVPNPDKAGEMIEVAKGLYIGEILGEVINFVSIAFVVFLMIRALEKAKTKFQRQQAVAGEAAPEVLLQERMANTLDRLADVLEKR